MYQFALNQTNRPRMSPWCRELIWAPSTSSNVIEELKVVGYSSCWAHPTCAVVTCSLWWCCMQDYLIDARCWTWGVGLGPRPWWWCGPGARWDDRVCVAVHSRFGSLGPVGPYVNCFFIKLVDHGWALDIESLLKPHSLDQISSTNFGSWDTRHDGLTLLALSSRAPCGHDVCKIVLLMLIMGLGVLV